MGFAFLYVIICLLDFKSTTKANEKYEYTFAVQYTAQFKKIGNGKSSERSLKCVHSQLSSFIC